MFSCQVNWYQTVPDNLTAAIRALSVSLWWSEVQTWATCDQMLLSSLISLSVIHCLVQEMTSFPLEWCYLNSLQGNLLGSDKTGRSKVLAHDVETVCTLTFAVVSSLSCCSRLVLRPWTLSSVTVLSARLLSNYTNTVMLTSVHKDATKFHRREESQNQFAGSGAINTDNNNFFKALGCIWTFLSLLSHEWWSQKQQKQILRIKALQ